MQAERIVVMSRSIARYSDERLERELAFAEGFNDPGEQEWLELLRAEWERRHG